MIRALHIIDTGGPGGAETVFSQMVMHLDASRFQSTVVVGGMGWLAGQLRLRGVTPHVLTAKGSFNVRYLLSVIRLARQCKCDVMVAHLYGSAVYASLAGMLLSIPVVAVLHGQTDVPSTERLSTFKASVLRRGSRKVIFVSERLRDHLRHRLGLTDTQCAVIPNGVDTNVFQRSSDRSLRAELGLTEDTILVGAIGNIRPPKAYEVLLRAARLAVDRSQRLHFIIAGDGENALGTKLIELRHTLKLERHVTFLGLRSDVARILNNLDAFVLSSRTEGFSIACIEAMACGVPVVATRSGGPEQILADGAGLLIPTDDPRSLADAIDRLTSSKTLAATLTAIALERVQQKYSLEKMLSRYEDLLTDVVGSSRH